MTRDERFMSEAIRVSVLAAEHGNEPFGAVLVKDGEIVYSSENQIYTGSDPTFHAEAGLLRRFCAETHITDLIEYTMYASCEPCFMCCGAMVWFRLGRLVYGAGDIDLCSLWGETGAECCRIVFEHSAWKPQVTSGVLRDRSMEVLTGYFKDHKKG
ncbi:MAG TPA: nucleoside deaminase [Clostridia bacterium]|nr:nucleoside deaminase [Clostridia bacterium]